jgi:hypothetical protein
VTPAYIENCIQERPLVEKSVLSRNQYNSGVKDCHKNQNSIINHTSRFWLVFGVVTAPAFVFSLVSLAAEKFWVVFSSDTWLKFFYVFSLAMEYFLVVL